ncbi:hypothetical protein L7F22_032159 [Adiantum nelumboides]|nr:hypothetical protein [Adiantum nelumboides]
MHLEGGEGVPVMHGPMQANVVPHPLQGPLQTDGAKKKQYHGQERHVGKIREEGDFHDDDDEPPSRSRHKKRTNERRTKRSRRNSSGGSSSSSQSGRSSHGRFPKKVVNYLNLMNNRKNHWSSANKVDRVFWEIKIQLHRDVETCYACVHGQWRRCANKAHVEAWQYLRIIPIEANIDQYVSSDEEINARMYAGHHNDLRNALQVGDNFVVNAEEEDSNSIY